MEIGVYFMPSSKTATLCEFDVPLNAAFQLSRILTGSFTVPGCSSIPPGVAPFAKNLAPYSSQAIAIPIAFFAIAIGEYPTSPSKPSPGMCSTSVGCRNTVFPFIVGASSLLVLY